MTHFIHFKFLCVFILVQHQFSPILILLFKHSSKCEGVQKILLENLSYLFVYDPHLKIKQKSVKKLKEHLILENPKSTNFMMHNNAQQKFEPE
jgi:hypothetical protein